MLQVGDLVQIADDTYTRQQILGMEKAILNKMEWNLTVPTMYVFLARFAKAAGSDDKEVNKNLFLSPSYETPNQLSSLKLISVETLFSVRVDADGEYGVLLWRAGADGIQHGDTPPLVCRSFSSVRCSMHPHEDSSLDRHFEVPHWLRRVSA